MNTSGTLSSIDCSCCNYDCWYSVIFQLTFYSLTHSGMLSHQSHDSRLSAHFESTAFVRKRIRCASSHIFECTSNRFGTERQSIYTCFRVCPWSLDWGLFHKHRWRKVRCTVYLFSCCQSRAMRLWEILWTQWIIIVVIFGFRHSFLIH